MMPEDLDYTSTYAGMEDEELLQVARDYSDLVDTAKMALGKELDKRGLKDALAKVEAAGDPESDSAVSKDERLVLLAHFSTAPEAAMVRELLLQNGIACVLQGGNFGALEPLPLQGGFSEIRLLVSQDELSRAQELYEAFFVKEAAQEDENASGSAQQEETNG